MNTIFYAKEISVTKTYDIIVCGAGPAGICAAVAAARQGAKVALIERYGIPGGNLTAGDVRCRGLHPQKSECEGSAGKAHRHGHRLVQRIQCNRNEITGNLRCR